MSTLRTNALEGMDAKNSITIVAGAGNITTTNVQVGLAKSSIRCPDTGDSITSSFNITSLTDSSAGRVVVIIANNMADANYATAECTDENVSMSYSYSMTTSQYQQDTYTGSGYQDIGKMSQTFGDLA